MKWLIAWLAFTARVIAGPLTVATYNLEFYVDAPALGAAPKTVEAKRLIRDSIKRINPDVIALQEMGSPGAFEELKSALRQEGVDFPHTEYVKSWDTNLRLAFLSKHPISARRPHTNESFLYQGKRFRVARGFGEIEVQLRNGERVSLITAHLKSKRQVGEADQQGLREEEAVLLREKVDEFFQREPAGKLIVLGDFNDDPGTRTLRTILGRGRNKLFDPRPAEQNGDTLPNPKEQFEPRQILWTHYYGKEESYSRLDYILVSANLRPALSATQSYVLAMPNWGAASDHRPVVVRLDLPN